MISLSLVNSYRVSLPVFEGPLDLLLHLIRKEDISITEIPIAKVLDQYVETIELMQELNIDLAGEFVLMAAELAHIKSKMLLPSPEKEEGEEGEDPRADLARRLLEYQRFKDAAALLSFRPMLGREVFTRPPPQVPKEEADPSTLQVDPFKLLSAFHTILKNLKPEHYHQVVVEKFSVTERIYELMEVLKGSEYVAFESLFEGAYTKGECIVTFLALLEMTRLKLIHVFQSEIEAPIRVQWIQKEEVTEVIPEASEFDQSR